MWTKEAIMQANGAIVVEGEHDGKQTMQHDCFSYKTIRSGTIDSLIHTCSSTRNKTEWT